MANTSAQLPPLGNIPPPLLTLESKRLHDERLAAIAAKYDKTPAQVVLRWNLQHGVVPIPKAARADHQQENLEVFDFDLEAIDIATLDGLNEQFSALEKLEYL